MISLNIIIYIDISMIDGIPAISHVGGPLTPIESLTSLCIMMSVFLRKTTEIVFFSLGQCSVVIMEDNHKES